jgi:DNA-binding LacI/PurR family transcriptional regulator/DNA-binding transcriptional regulator YhcF (GntR family)
MRRGRPLYWQVADDIVERIEGGTWRSGEKLPSERELCERYRVSQITVRRALRELDHQGRVYSHHGLGWFVNTPSADETPLREVWLVAPTLSWPLTRVIQCLSEDLAEQGVEVRFCLTQGSKEREAADVRRLADLKPEAVMLVVGGAEQGVLERYRTLTAQLGSRCLLLWQDVPGLQAPVVALDELGCMQEITRHLLSLGHRRIAYAGLDANLIEGQRRYWGFASTLWEQGLELPLNWVFSGDLDNGTEHDRFLVAFSDLQAPTALVCASDLRAAQAMQTLGEAGLHCPEDIAIVSVGDQEFAPLLPTPLTSLRPGLDELGHAAASAVLALMAGREIESVRLVGSLVVRQSCGASHGAF